MKKYLMPLGIAALLLTGCASEDAEPSKETSSPVAEQATAPASGMSQGSFTFEVPGFGAGTLDVPGEAPADIEEMTAMAGSEAVTYLTGNFDNREGSESFDVFTVTVYDNAGVAYEFQPAQDYIGDITPDSEVVGADVYNRYVDAYNTYSTTVDAMGRKDFVMVGPELPDDIAGVSVSNGFEDFGAMPAG